VVGTSMACQVWCKLLCLKLILPLFLKNCEAFINEFINIINCNAEISASQWKGLFSSSQGLKFTRDLIRFFSCFLLLLFVDKTRSLCVGDCVFLLTIFFTQYSVECLSSKYSKLAQTHTAHEVFSLLGCVVSV
jgi:hypothetical protein